MTTGCGCGEAPVKAPTDQGVRRALWMALWLNAALFILEFGAGLWANSSALLADSADNLGDALVYGLSLYALHRSLRWRAGATFIKGLIQVAFGLGVLLEVGIKTLVGGAPLAPAMAVVGVSALAVNLTCFLLLYRYRARDMNLRSVWLCSRNDLIGNVGVLAAAGAVALSGSFWPDLLVGALLAGIFLHTGVAVVRSASHAWRTGTDPIEDSCCRTGS